MFLFKKLFGSDKINFWLALWGGAARWLAHIWVLRYLEENNLVPSEIAGTSMWAIIWSAVAFWKTSGEIENIIKEIKFINLLDFDLKTWVVHW